MARRNPVALALRALRATVVRSARLYTRKRKHRGRGGGTGPY